MQNIFIIGTIHGYTPYEELEQVLEPLSLSQLFIELPPDAEKNIQSGKDIRNEMWHIYLWAKQKNIPTMCFDVYMPLFREGKSPQSPEFAELIQEQKDIIAQYSWKEFNQEDVSNKLSTELEKSLFDPEKAQRREEKMLTTIQEYIDPQGNIGIITGTAHLPFFEKHFDGAHFPIREMIM